jgi:carbamoyltransferase
MSDAPDAEFDLNSLNDEELAEHVAGLLAGGAVIGWVQGQAEWGPRALGARSILADPTNPAMKRIVNERVKFRELFRPFAPAVTAEAASQYFDFEPNLAAGAPEYYMLAVHPVRAEKKSVIPAITHAESIAPPLPTLEPCSTAWHHAPFA